MQVFPGQSIKKNTMKVPVKELITQEAHPLSLLGLLPSAGRSFTKTKSPSHSDQPVLQCYRPQNIHHMQCGSKPSTKPLPPTSPILNQAIRSPQPNPAHPLYPRPLSPQHLPFPPALVPVPDPPSPDHLGPSYTFPATYSSPTHDPY